MQVNVINADILQRNGFIVTSGLSKLASVRMRADVPQRVYDSATPANYNVRRIYPHHHGPVTLPIQTTDTISYGNGLDVRNRVTVQVDEYVTRRRIPVQPSSHAV